eukprot:1182364-Prorocentrum_minimum.AAC.1
MRGTCNNINSFYGSSCANNGKGALNTPETQSDEGKGHRLMQRPGGQVRHNITRALSGVLSAPLPLLAQRDP